MKPDRFEEIVLSHSYDEDYIPTCEAVTLLRRQHAAYVRLVTKFPCSYADPKGVCHAPDQTSCIVRRSDLLAALARYRKGGT